MNESDDVHVERLREVLVRMPDRIAPETVQRVAVKLDCAEVKAAAEILAADLDAHRPTVTWSELHLLSRAITWNSRFLDEGRHPHLWRHSYILQELPIVSRGDGAAPPWTTVTFLRALGEIIEELADRLHPVSLDHARSQLRHGEEGLALESVAGSLELSPVPVTREEWEKLRRVLLFYDVDDRPRPEESVPRGEAIIAALPVTES